MHILAQHPLKPGYAPVTAWGPQF